MQDPSASSDLRIGSAGENCVTWRVWMTQGGTVINDLKLNTLKGVFYDG